MLEIEIMEKLQMLVMQDLGSDSGMRLIWLVGGKAH